MNRMLRISLSALLMVAMTASYFAVFATPAAALQDTGIVNKAVTIPGDRSLSVDLGSTLLPSLTADEKIDTVLAERMQRTMELLKVYVLVTDREAVNSYLRANDILEIAGAQVPGLPTTRVMELYPHQIDALAKNPGIYKIMTFEEPVFDDVPLERALENTPVEIATPGTEDYDVDYLHGAVDAWSEGFTGDDVKIAVIDTGMDMSHPDLQGQQARYEDPLSPYFGWPIAYDDRAAYFWANDEIEGWVANTVATSGDLGGYVTFDGRNYNIAGLKDVMDNAVVSQSGVYHIGYHTDRNLMNLWGDNIGVLVVDAVTPGWYDTVYVDVTDDLDFANDKACTKGDEISYFDFYDTWTSNEDWTRWNGGDGYADLAGGMVYWISDGANMLPGVDWLYGGSFTPASGEAVAFVGEFSLGESHGTMTSSTALGTGASYFGQLAGMAPNAELIAIPFTNDVVSSWLFAEMGADGLPGTGDEANIVSNSYGYSNTAIEAGYTVYDMYTSYISLLGGQTLWFWSTGNGGPGYGTVHSPVDFLAVHCGATTTMQYRYWLGMEEFYQYTSWGDIAPFSNSGPSRTGKLNAEIAASGMYSMEPAPLNLGAYGGLGDGFVHFQLGSGTSHATPTVAGGAALGFQSYYQVYGDWPWIDYAKAKLIAAADDMHYDPLKQGSGWLNASTYARTMGEYAGVDSVLFNEPVLYNAVLYPGSLDGTMLGTSYDNFANFLLPDEIDDTHVVTTTNYDPLNPADVTISGELLLLTSSSNMAWTTPDSGDQWIDIRSMIPGGTDLVKITWYMPMDEFDPELDYRSNYAYWLETHDWVDTNSDGIMNITGTEWELYRMSVDGSDCNYNQISVRDPLERTHDGLMVRVRAIDGDGGLDMNLQIDCYELQTFDWLQFRIVGNPVYSPTLTETIPAMSSIDWQIEVHVPFDAYVGTYAAGIYVNDGTRVQCIPVVINVPATDYEFAFGGANYFDTPYNNDITGEADKGWRFEVGDWRIYWCLPTAAAPSVDAQLVVTVSWSDLPTDVNVHVLAAVGAGGWDTYAPPFGPDLLETAIASSNERYMGAGTFGVGTNTGGPMEVLSAPLGQYIDLTGPAPFAILTRCPVMDGYQAKDTISGSTAWLTLNGYDPAIVTEQGQSGWVPGWYDITVGGMVEARGGGIGPLRSDTYPSEEIYQDSMTGSFVYDLSRAAYTRSISVVGSPLLTVATSEVSGVPDLDLGLWRDDNLNGNADLSEPYWYVGISGSSESLSLEDPADGTYLVKCLGYTVTGSPGYFSLTIMKGVPGFITVFVYEDWVLSGSHDFEIQWSLPAESGSYFGLASFGFMGADDMVLIPVTIVLDVTSPTIENAYPADASTIGTSSLVVTFDVVDPGGYSGGIDWTSIQVGIDQIWYFSPGSMHMQITPPSVTLTVPVSLAEGAHLVEIWAEDSWGNPVYVANSFTVNSIFETFTAEWADPGTGNPIADGATVAMTNVILRGLTDPDSAVEVSSPAGTYSVVADPNGTYELDPFALVSGLNIVTVTTTNAGNVSASMVKMITSDMFCTLWALDVESPTADPTTRIVGMTDIGATLTFNSVPVAVNPDGTFGQDVALSEGMNTIVIEAVDPIGNTNQITVDVVLDTTPPSLAITTPMDGANTSEPSVLVQGTTDAGATVRVNGVVASNGTANWSATVVLSEGVNTVVVTAEDEVANSVMRTVSVEYIPPDYVTPEELAAVQTALLDLIANVSASLAENVTVLQGEIDGLSAALAENVSALQADIAGLATSLAENVTTLQGQIDAAVADISDLQTSLAENVSALQSAIDAAVASISALQTALAENVTALQTADGQLAADLQANVTALTASIASNVAALQTLIDALEGDVSELQTDLAAEVADLQAQLDSIETSMAGMNDSVQDDLTDLEDQIDDLNQTTQDDIGAVEDQAEDTDAFAGMLMYLTLVLFAIAIILVGIVWYVMNGKLGGGGSGGSAQSLEEVDETPSEVEREFEQLEREIKDEEK